MSHKGTRISQHSDNNTALHHMCPVGVSVQYTIARCPSPSLSPYIDSLWVLPLLTIKVELPQAGPQHGKGFQEGVVWMVE